LEVPRVLFALAAVPLVAGVVGEIAPTSALMLGGALAVSATLETLIRFRATARDRKKADALIVTGNRLPADLAWREQELCDGGQRTMLARSIRRLLRSLDREVVMTAQVVNRPAARAQRGGLDALATRLESLDRPVAALGMVRVRTLLTDGHSPLFDRIVGDDLPEHIRRALRDLEPRP
jgi:hypothetical protein